MKTSSRLSRQFTLICAGLLVCFAVVVNILFFRSWYVEEVGHQKSFREYQGQSPKKPPLFVGRVQKLSLTDYAKLETHPSRRHNLVSYGDNQRLLIHHTKNTHLIITEVTPLVRRQMSLIRLSLLLVALGAVVSYLISRRFARRALRDVYTVADRTTQRDINNLNQTLNLDHLPEDDEIRTIADSLDTMTTTLHDQVGQIKRFVSNLSHEIKTPLMASRTHAELALKTGNHEHGLQTTTAEIDQLHRLVDVLTTLHHTDHGELDHQPIVIEPLVKTIHAQVEMQHEAQIHYQQAIADGLMLYGDHGAWEIILRNLLDNAYKYTPVGGHITLTADDSHLAIHNTGSSLTQEQLTHIREPLRQADSSKGHDQGFGLGLTLVQTLVEKMGYEIEAVSDESGVRFEIDVSSGAKRSEVEESSTK